MIPLKEIIAIHGTPGLFKVVAKGGNNTIIVESLIDNKRTAVPGTEQITYLGDIAVFTTGEDMPLREVMKKIVAAETETPAVNPNADGKILKEYFKKIIPEIDDNRVYPSNLKKILSWYNMLRDKVDFTKEDAEGDEKININSDDEREKPMAKTFDTHAAKADIHAKTTTAKTRKKV